jgi:ABC-2 type transport system permease protein
MVGFAVIYAPRVTGSSGIPPQLFINAITRSGSTGFTPFTAEYLGWGVLVPLVLFALSWVLIRRRDVV